jgi:hypothetical protein
MVALLNQAGVLRGVRPPGRTASRIVSHVLRPLKQFNQGTAKKSALELGQHNSLLVLILALAIGIADLTGFIGAKEQNLAQPFVGVNLGR